MNSNGSWIIFSLFQANETKEKVDALKSDNKELEDKISALGQVVKWIMSIWGQTVTKVFQEMKFLKDVFIAHAGNSSNSAATASSTSTSAVSGTLALKRAQSNSLF